MAAYTSQRSLSARQDHAAKRRASADIPADELAAAQARHRQGSYTRIH
jgi:hypothetical protein